MGEINIAVVLHIDGDLAIFLLFCYHQDTESESQEMEIGVSGPIISQKKHKMLYGTTISILYKMDGEYCINYSF